MSVITDSQIMALGSFAIKLLQQKNYTVELSMHQFVVTYGANKQVLDTVADLTCFAIDAAPIPATSVAAKVKEGGSNEAN